MALITSTPGDIDTARAHFPAKIIGCDNSLWLAPTLARLLLGHRLSFFLDKIYLGIKRREMGRKLFGQ